jgi:GAF domain-containing protein
MLAVPLMRQGKPIGAMALSRTKPGLFAPRQVELVQTFADQAVIAIENVRLFSEVQAKTHELQESLQQQTATSDVLKIISRSTVDLNTVLDTLVETAALLCRADQVHMFSRRDDRFHMLAARGLTEEARDFFLTHPLAVDRGTISGRVVLERRVVHVPDVLEDPEYTYWEGQKLTGVRTMLGIPLLREDALIGIFIISRTRVEPFMDKESELATTFADQAVIAIENARLFWGVARPSGRASRHLRQYGRRRRHVRRPGAPYRVEPQFPGDARSA